MRWDLFRQRVYRVELVKRVHGQAPCLDKRMKRLVVVILWNFSEEKYYNIK